MRLQDSYIEFARAAKEDSRRARLGFTNVALCDLLDARVAVVELSNDFASDELVIKAAAKGLGVSSITLVVDARMTTDPKLMAEVLEGSLPHRALEARAGSPEVHDVISLLTAELVDGEVRSLQRLLPYLEVAGILTWKKPVTIPDYPFSIGGLYGDALNEAVATCRPLDLRDPQAQRLRERTAKKIERLGSKVHLFTTQQT